MTYGQIANNDDPDGTYHIPDERGSNYPFHPVSLCGIVLTRELVEDTSGTICKSCSGEKSHAAAVTKTDEKVPATDE